MELSKITSAKSKLVLASAEDGASNASSGDDGLPKEHKCIVRNTFIEAVANEPPYDSGGSSGNIKFWNCCFWQFRALVNSSAMRYSGTIPLTAPDLL